MWNNPSIRNLFWQYYKISLFIFPNISSATHSRWRSVNKYPHPVAAFPYFLISLFNQDLINLIELCINTFACLKINQYSTGLFVSYSWINPIAQNYFYIYFDNFTYLSIFWLHIWRYESTHFTCSASGLSHYSKKFKVVSYNCSIQNKQMFSCPTLSLSLGHFTNALAYCGKLENVMHWKVSEVLLYKLYNIVVECALKVFFFAAKNFFFHATNFFLQFEG